MPRSTAPRFLVLLSHTSAGRLLAGLILWLALTVGLRPLALPDEGRYAGIAWSMAAAGDWLIPTLDGMPFFHKPPLFYWLTEIGFIVFGSSAGSARIASVLGGALLLCASYLFLKRYQSRSLATMTVLVLATQPIFYLGSQFANLDMLVAGLITATILAGADAIFRAEAGSPWQGAALLAFVLAALGVLAKGLIGIVLPFAVIIIWLAWRRAWASIRVLFWIPGLVVFLLVAGPWFVWMQHLYPGFFDYFVIYHHIQRFSQTGFNNQMPFWFYVPVLLVLALPWTPWLARMLTRNEGQESDTTGVRSLMLIWFLVILVFFSLPRSKLVGYILPALLPLAYLIAVPFSRWIDRAPGTASRWFGGTMMVAVLACIVGVVMVRGMDQKSNKAISEQWQPQLKPDDEIAMVNWYFYDLAFYLRHSRPIWVVSDWGDPTIPAHDTWRKELLDASRFDPEVGRKVLINATELTRRACAQSVGALWLVGRADASNEVAWLKRLTPVMSDHTHVVWHLSSASLTALGVCGERPSSG